MCMHAHAFAQTYTQQTNCSLIKVKKEIEKGWKGFVIYTGVEEINSD